MSFASRTKCGQMVVFLKNCEVMHSLTGILCYYFRMSSADSCYFPY